MEDKLCCDDIILDEKYCADWESIYHLVLNPVTMNCGQCYKCHRWTTDRERSNYVEGLCNGATVDGVLLCDECLPKGHPWAF